MVRANRQDGPPADAYRWLEPHLGVFERRRPKPGGGPEEPRLNSRYYHAIVHGFGRFGLEISQTLLHEGKTIAVVDFDPEAIARCRARGIEAYYGDTSDPDFVAHLPLERTDWVISTVHGLELSMTHEDPRLALLNALKHHGYQGRIALTTHRPADVEAL